MCDECIDLCPHTPGGDPIEPADSPEAQSQSDALAKRILNGLGFCGHYMHFHGGVVAVTAVAAGDVAFAGYALANCKAGHSCA